MHKNKGKKAIGRIVRSFDNCVEYLNRRSNYGNDKVPEGEIKG